MLAPALPYSLKTAWEKMLLRTVALGNSCSLGLGAARQKIKHSLVALGEAWRSHWQEQESLVLAQLDKR